MKAFAVVGLISVFVLAGCAKDGKVGNTKIWETPASTTQPKKVWKNDSGAPANAPTTIWKRADGTSIIDLDSGDGSR